MLPEIKQAHGNPEICVHFWIIDPPGKTTSLGRCCKCLIEKKFKNSIAVDQGGWTNTKDKPQS